MERYMVKEDQRSLMVEAYRKVAANIEFSNIDNDIKVIMGTSSLSGEGKTTTISNVAYIMTEARNRILLIDLDLRKPTLHKQFKISNKRGVTDLLLNKDHYSDYINVINPRLDVITAGNIPANPYELLNSKAIKEFISQISQSYDYVFLDAPPIMLTSDPLAIASFSDALIFTIAYAETEKDIVKKSINSLLKVNANIVGTILNKVPVTKQNKYYYSYY